MRPRERLFGLVGVGSRVEHLRVKIVHVIAGVGGAAGTSTFVENVIRGQRQLGHEVELVTNDEGDLMQAAERSGSEDSAIFHLHGLWSPLLYRACRVAVRAKIPIVWSTHGMTAPWALHHKWWKKWLPWHLYQKCDLKHAALIHCTTKLEETWNRALGFTNTCIVPLGTKLPPQPPHPPQPSQPKTLLFVGRLYPVKALDNAIRAVTLMKSSIKLRLVGPDQGGHRSELEALCKCLGVQDKVDFVGSKFDADLEAEYWACDGLILVSHTENFGATVADALAHGKPVITSTKTPWQSVIENKCGWWVENSPESLARTFDEFASISDAELNQFGQNGRALVERDYSWASVVKCLLEQYRSLI